nr:class IV adenylate cyclase [Kibdelosporangium sp. MJ126-NF4]CEL16582.1 Adenylate cyclase [Kibdelosporangium sp. MJ126-NF4]CTQ89067.1 Adenylate cyclase (EC 4.6.1.1) [Kibdelosporangium sp. MJ126-NF4]
MSLIEVERKRELSGTSETLLRARLVELGYHADGSVTEIDTYYSRPDRDYLTTVECLRVRQRDGFAEITYKPASTTVTHSADDVIAKQETNVALRDIDQAEAAHRLLTAIGMIPLARVEKTRAMYRHPHHPQVIVNLDTVTGVGTFLETEVIDIDPERAAGLLEQTEQQLDITGHPVVGLSYRDLVLQHAQPADAQPAHLIEAAVDY